MTGLAETLQIALVTEQAFDVGVEVNKASGGIHDGNSVVNLHLSGGEVVAAFVAPIVLCQSSRLHINLLLCLCFFQGFIPGREFP